MIFQTMLYMFLVYFLSIIFHELGHWVYFRAELDRPVKLRFFYRNKEHFGIKVGTPQDYEGLTKEQLTEVYLSGIVTGVVFLSVAIVVNVMFFFVFAPYFLACKSDIKNILGLRK